MLPSLETTRLYLPPLELADAAEIQMLFPRWEIVRYMTRQVPWPYPPDGAYRYCHDVALPAVERGDAWHWTLRVKTNPLQVIGGISLMRGEADNRGFWLGLQWQKQGLMSEACEAATDYWFRDLRFAIMRVHKAIANEPSRRISAKQGMRMVASEEREYVSGCLRSEVWEITAAEWRMRRHPK
jgi:ribosomal-protein-alanine N-acetyltransferase